MPTHLLLIDALNLIRRIHAVEAQYEGVNADKVFVNTYHRTRNAVTKILKRVPVTHAIAVFDGDTSWRYHYFPDYKCSRKPMSESLKKNLPNIAKAFSELGITVYTPINDEADDVIATLAHKAQNAGIRSTIISTDKGFLPHLSHQVSIYDYFKNTYLDQEYVEKKFSVPYSRLTEYWALQGDKTNDIPGVNGIGKTSAIKLISKFADIQDVFALEQPPHELKRIHNKINGAENDYIRAKLLVSLRVDIQLGFSLKELRIINE